MLGNVIGPVFVYATGLISVSMILASGLSFLGLGVKPPAAEWGLMLNTLRSAIYVDPTLAALPGVMIFATSMAFNLLADGVRAALDIRPVKRRARIAALPPARRPRRPGPAAADRGPAAQAVCRLRGGQRLRAVDGVSFSVAKGETLAVVG